MGGEERVARQHASGRLTVRERLERLLDEGSFHETGALAGVGTYGDDGELEDFLPANCVVGTGRIAGRRAALQADDFTVRGGAADAAIWQKMVWAERAAHDLRIPLVRLVDGTGGGGSVKTLETMGFSYVPPLPGFELTVANLSIVPVVAAALGPDGGPRRRPRRHLALQRDRARHRAAVRRRPAGRGRRDGRVAGQGGARRRAHADARRRRRQRGDRRGRRVRPAARASSPTCPTTCGRRRRWPRRATPPDRREEELLSIVPRESRSTYKMRRILEAVLDRGSLFEIGRQLRALAHHRAGPARRAPRRRARRRPRALRRRADRRRVRQARALRRPVRPVPPAGRQLRRPARLRDRDRRRAGRAPSGAARGRCTRCTRRRVPWVSILVRKVFGIAGAGHGDGSRLNLRYAWPSGDWGSLPIEGGIEAAYRRELEAADDPVALRAEIEERLNAVRSPVPHRRALQRRGDHRPARHPPDPVRLGGARARADPPRAAGGAQGARAAALGLFAPSARADHPGRTGRVAHARDVSRSPAPTQRRRTDGAVRRPDHHAGHARHASDCCRAQRAARRNGAGPGRKNRQHAVVRADRAGRQRGRLRRPLQRRSGASCASSPAARAPRAAVAPDLQPAAGARVLDEPTVSVPAASSRRVGLILEQDRGDPESNDFGTFRELWTGRPTGPLKRVSTTRRRANPVPRGSLGRRRGR